MKSILFVCTGNIFRSMTAEYALKAALGLQSAYRVSSAGIDARPYVMSADVRERLDQHQLDPTPHQQRQVTASLLHKADLVVAMGLNHRVYLKEQFGREAWLFNQICFGLETSVLDVGEALPDEPRSPAVQQAYIYAVVDYLYEAMPHFIKNVEGFLAQTEIISPA